MQDPDWSALPAGTPCRFADCCVGVWKKIASGGSTRQPMRGWRSTTRSRLRTVRRSRVAAAPSRRVTPVAIAALAGGAVVAALVAWAALTRPAPAAPVLPSRFAIVPSPAEPLNVSRLDRDIAVSPDGRRFVYRAGGSRRSAPR